MKKRQPPGRRSPASPDPRPALDAMSVALLADLASLLREQRNRARADAEDATVLFIDGLSQEIPALIHRARHTALGAVLSAGQ